MAFQDSAVTLRSRLHMGDVKPSVLIGVLVVGAVVVTCALFALANGVADHTMKVERAESAEAAEAEAAVGEGTAAAPVAEVCVYVSGCVASPGVYVLGEGARVGEAIDLAGGFTQDAATGSLNLARILNDGEQVDVPSSAQEAAQAQGTSGSPVAGSGKVNINSAGSEDLQRLDGVGESTAEKIIAEREANGPFRSIEDIKRVSGIGDKKYEAIKNLICV